MAAVLVVLGLWACQGIADNLPDDDPAPRAEKCTEYEGYASAGDSCAARERAACRDFWGAGLEPSRCERYR